MIRHVVILKLKENAPLDKIKTEILQLTDFIDVIIHMEVGIDIGFDPASSNLCIIADFKDKKDLEIYAKHPKHLEVIKNHIKPFLIERNVVDYEKESF